MADVPQFPEIGSPWPPNPDYILREISQGVRVVGYTPSGSPIKEPDGTITVRYERVAPKAADNEAFAKAVEQGVRAALSNLVTN